jgi:RHS repeat-associated protein
VIDHSRTLYRRNDLVGPLPVGQVEAQALPFETYSKAFTPGLAHALFVASGKLSDGELVATLSAEGGYVQLEAGGGWWRPSGRVLFHPEPVATAEEELALARQHFFSLRRFRDPFHNETRFRHDTYDLIGLEAEDALGNKVSAGERDGAGNVTPHIDYRLLQPFLMTDPNGNRSAVAFDTLGQVAGTAVMGKSGENLGDSLQGFAADLSQMQIDAFLSDPLGQAGTLLGGATTRFVYDADRHCRTGDSARPGFVASVAREQHLSDLAPSVDSPVQVSLAFGDGFGRAIQTKNQAEPGPVVDGGPPVAPRWVASGWTIFNNKGQPVRRYEPFFSAGAEFEFGRAVGVSSTLFYDPLGRTLATLHPDHTYDKVRFDPWRQETWDVNDTVTLDPLADPDVAPFFMRLPPFAFRPTWFELRTQVAFAAEAEQRWPDAARRDSERQAAVQAAAHQMTPAVAHLDALGRPFLSVADNAPAGKYLSRVELDVEGNLLSSIDALGRTIVVNHYDMLGNRLHQIDMDAGACWLLNDAHNKALLAWDDRGRRFLTRYDPLRRPTESLLREGQQTEAVVGRTIYGETAPNPEVGNFRGRVIRVFDQAGLEAIDAYDFKGNVVGSRRQLAADYRATIDWTGTVALEADIHFNQSRFDALNRPVALTLPDGTVVRPIYNITNLLERVDADLRGETPSTAFVVDVEYNARSQRTRIAYGNGVYTTYEYDPATFRLVRLRTMRADDGVALQDLHYVGDPAGNITSLRDEAQQTVYFSNQAVTADTRYRHDALYRLVEAEGREHVGQTSRGEPTWDDAFRTRLPHPGDGQAMRRFTEHYEYDEVGNFLRLIHQAATGNWTRDYTYDEPSLVDPARQGNRLSRTMIGGETELYTYDSHGNITRMPHLATMEWSFRDQLRAVQRQVVNGAPGEMTYYVYDATGQRVRKVTDRADGSRQKERLYLGNFERYREYGASGSVALERESVRIMAGAQPTALVETRTQGDDGAPAQLIKYQLGNHLGSATLELDEAAQIISYEEYHPYGTTSYQAGRNLAEVSLKRYRYAGKERDEETGFTYHGARYHAPWLGRWTSCDPAGSKVSQNPYLAFGGNPAVRVDNDGADDVSAWAMAAARGALNAGVPGAGYLLDVPVVKEKAEKVANAASQVAEGVRRYNEATAVPEQEPPKSAGEWFDRFVNHHFGNILNPPLPSLVIRHNQEAYDAEEHAAKIGPAMREGDYATATESALHVWHFWHDVGKSIEDAAAGSALILSPASAASSIESKGMRSRASKPSTKPSSPKPRGGPGKSTMASREAAASTAGAEPVAIVNGKQIAPGPARTYYHGAKDVAPSEALTNGLPARGANRDLLNHVEEGPDSGFRGATQLPSDPVNQGGAAYWVGEGGWVYKVRARAWDTNQLLEGRVKTGGGEYRGNLMHGENEFAIDAQIPASQIEAYGQVVTNSRGQLYVKEWIPNPNYKPE